MAVNGTIAQSTWTDTGDLSGKTPKAQYISELRTAINRLSTFTPNVTNCGFSNYCQTCQSLTCQTYSCQVCQACQVCQSAGLTIAECRKSWGSTWYQCAPYGTGGLCSPMNGDGAYNRFQCHGDGTTGGNTSGVYVIYNCL